MYTEATIQSYSYEKVIWKYAANLQENTHAEVRFQVKHMTEIKPILICSVL